MCIRDSYNVASNELRKSVKYSKNQNEVWLKVDNLLKSHSVETQTRTYAALDKAQDFKDNLNQYLTFFDGKFKDAENIVGMMVLNGDELLGTDVFGHSELFKKQFEALLHAYVTDAIQKENLNRIEPLKLKRLADRINKDFARQNIRLKSSEALYSFDGNMVHYTNLAIGQNKYNY